MNIGIFGDSYANYKLEAFDNENSRGLSWTELLAEHHNVTNFGYAGSALKYSYQLYFEHKNKFDLSIFVVTSYNRVWIKELGPNQPGHFALNSKFLNAIKSKAPADEEIINIIESIEVWKKYWRDPKFENHLCELMVLNLLDNDNILLIPGFKESVPGYDKPFQNLTDWQFWELLQIDPSFNPGDVKEKRKCHFSEENNRVLYNAVNSALKTKEKVLLLDNLPWTKPCKDISFYATIKED